MNVLFMYKNVWSPFQMGPMLLPGQSGSEHDRVSTPFPLHLSPPFLACCRIFRFLCCNPSPQVTEHLLHGPKPDHTQSIGPILMNRLI